MEKFLCCFAIYSKIARWFPHGILKIQWPNVVAKYMMEKKRQTREGYSEGERGEGEKGKKKQVIYIYVYVVYKQCVFIYIYVYTMMEN